MTQKTKPKPGGKDSKSRATLWWIVGGVVGLGLIVALAASIATEPEIDASIGYGDPTVEGDSLPVYATGTQDVAIGLTAPTVTGADWEGNPVTIEPTAKVAITSIPPERMVSSFSIESGSKVGANRASVVPSNHLAAKAAPTEKRHIASGRTHSRSVRRL